MNQQKDINLLVKLTGEVPDRHEIGAYDLGTILIQLQKVFGVVAGFELNRANTQFSDLRNYVSRMPPFARHSLVQVSLRDVRHGSVELNFGIIGSFELIKIAQEYPLTTSFIISVIANFFTSAAIAAGVKYRNRIKDFNKGDLDKNEQEELSYRILPMLSTLANKVDYRSGINSIEFRGSVMRDIVEWEFIIDANTKNEIFRYADKTVSPLSEYVGILGELSLFNRTGRLKNSFDDTLKDLAIPSQELCEKMANHLNREIAIMAQVEVTREVETRNLRTKYIVHNFRPL